MHSGSPASDVGTVRCENTAAITFICYVYDRGDDVRTGLAVRVSTRQNNTKSNVRRAGFFVLTYEHSMKETMLLLERPSSADSAYTKSYFSLGL